MMLLDDEKKVIEGPEGFSITYDEVYRVWKLLPNYPRSIFIYCKALDTLQKAKNLSVGSTIKYVKECLNPIDMVRRVDDLYRKGHYPFKGS
jgi:hypothetical protein